MRRGAKQIGLKVEWHFEFFGPGTKLKPERDIVAVDVGGELCPGIIDQHGLTYSTSTAAMVASHLHFAHAHLLDRWIDRFDQQGEPLGRTAHFTLRMHSDPDFDCLVSSWLVMRLVEDGAFPIFHTALTEYTTRVDQGKYPINEATREDALQSLHLGYLGLSGPEQNDIRRAIAAGLGLPPASPHETCIRIGHALLDDLARRERAEGGPGFTRLRSGWDFDPQKLRTRIQTKAAEADAAEAEKIRSVVTGWRKLPAIETHLVPVLDSDHGRFLDDQKDMRKAREAAAQATTETIEVPAMGGGTMRLAVYIAPKPMQARLNKYWVRGSGYPLFVCIYDVMKDGKVVADRKRYVISVDPNHRDPTTQRQPSLEGLGAALERRECEERGKNDLRDPEPRWEGVTNADPWYDGRSHEWGIIDTPRDGSALSPEKVVAVLRSRFWESSLIQQVERATHALTAPQSEDDDRPDDPPAESSDRHHPFVQQEMLPFLNGRSADDFGKRDTPLPEGWKLVLGTRSPSRTAELSQEAALTFGQPGQVTRSLEVFVIRVPATVAMETAVAHVRAMLPLSERHVHPFDRCTLIGGTSRQVFLASEALETAVLDASLQRALLLWTYVSWKDAKLSEYAARIAQIVPASRQQDARKIDVAAAEALSREFLRFEARFWQIEVVRPAYARAYHRFLVEQLQLGAQFNEIREEIKRAEDLARNELQSRQNALVSLVGLTSGVSAVQAAWPTLMRYSQTARDFLGIHPLLVSLASLLVVPLVGYLLFLLLDYVRPGTRKSLARARLRFARRLRGRPEGAGRGPASLPPSGGSGPAQAPKEP